ncbi:MAG TPA: phospholipase D-like domain-containing protein [Pirellulaceae bacterium]|nr:phospholipase D-like domain-containing protein [Pirellulaceae bacterium]
MAVKLLARNWQFELARCLSQTRQSLFICSPFITVDGCNLIRSHLPETFQSTGRLSILSDLSPIHLLQQATDPRALQSLLSSVDDGVLWHLPRVHAKVFIFDRSYAVVTSANLTAGGLYRNIEYGVGISDVTTVTAIHAELESFGRLAAPIDRPRLERYCELATEVTTEVSRQLRAVTSAAKSKLDKALRSTEDELLRWRSAGGRVTPVFADTIVFLLERDGPLSTAELHPRIKGIHPDLCDDAIDRVIDGRHFGKRWKHWVRSAQQRLTRDGRVKLIGGKWMLA